MSTGRKLVNTIEDMWPQKELVIPDSFHCVALKCDLESPPNTMEGQDLRRRSRILTPDP